MAARNLPRPHLLTFGTNVLYAHLQSQPRMTDEEISLLLLKLYRELPELPANEYVDHAFTLIRSALHFESGYIVNGHVDHTNGMKMNGINLFRQPNEKLVEYKDVAHLDLVVFRLVQHPNQVQAFSLDALYPKRVEFDPIRGFARRHDVAYTLNIAMPWANDGQMGGISLARAETSQAYTPEETRLADILFPHIMQCRQQKFRLIDATEQQKPMASWTAMCTFSGCLSHCAPPAIALLQREWASWSPPVLPAALMSALASSENRRFVGRNLVISARVIGPSLALQICEVNPSRNLTQAQRKVADLLVQGLSYKEVAIRLGLSDNTVRNHLTVMYRKINARNKVEFANNWQLLNSRI